MRHDRTSSQTQRRPCPFAGRRRHSATADARGAKSISTDAAAVGGSGRGDPRSVSAHSREFRHRGDEPERAGAVRTGRRVGGSCHADGAYRSRPGRRCSENRPVGVHAAVAQRRADGASRWRRDQLHAGRRPAECARHGAWAPPRQSPRLPRPGAAGAAFQLHHHARQPGLRAGRASGQFPAPRHLSRQLDADRQGVPRLGDRSGQGARRHRDDGDFAWTDA